MIRPSRVSSMPISERTRLVIPMEVAVKAAPTNTAVNAGNAAARVAR